MPLIIQGSHDGGPWRCTGVIFAGAPPGSITHVGPDGQREILLFWCEGDRSVIGISRGGTDHDAGPGARVVVTEGVDIVAELAAGEDFEMPVTSDQGLAWRARWRHVATLPGRAP